MKNVTVTLSDEVHRQARIRAAELGTSLSALVAAYLTSLAQEGGLPAGVREMPSIYKAQPPGAPTPPPADGPPWLIDGKLVYTKDGKPRQPGALRGMWIADDFDEWPDWMLDAFEGKDSELPWPDAKPTE